MFENEPFWKAALVWFLVTASEIDVEETIVCKSHPVKLIQREIDLRACHEQRHLPQNEHPWKTQGTVSLHTNYPSSICTICEAMRLCMG